MFDKLLMIMKNDCIIIGILIKILYDYYISYIMMQENIEHSLKIMLKKCPKLASKYSFFKK